MCESNENYVPLNDGYNWKGDPNATLSGQAVPQLPPGVATCASTSAAGPGAAANSGRRVRPRYGHVRWTGRACVHTVQSGPQCHRGANMADDADAPDGELSKSTATEETSSAAEPESAGSETAEAAKTETATETPTTAPRTAPTTTRTAPTTTRKRREEAAPAKPPMSHLRLATIVGLVLVVALGGLTGWLGFRAYQVPPGR